MPVDFSSSGSAITTRLSGVSPRVDGDNALVPRFLHYNVELNLSRRADTSEPKRPRVGGSKAADTQDVSLIGGYSYQSMAADVIKP